MTPIEIGALKCLLHAHLMMALLRRHLRERHPPRIRDCSIPLKICTLRQSENVIEIRVRRESLGDREIHFEVLAASHAGAYRLLRSG